MKSTAFEQEGEKQLPIVSCGMSFLCPSVAKQKDRKQDAPNVVTHFLSSASLLLTISHVKMARGHISSCSQARARVTEPGILSCLHGKKIPQMSQPGFDLAWGLGI